MTKTCQHCGTLFERGIKTPSNFRKAKFCGMACMNAAKKFGAEKSVEVMWSRIDKNGPNGCWIYSGQINSKGYGAFTYNGKPMVAVHRFIYQQVHGPIPRNVFCLHKCDTPRCCNPDHIFLGDDAANHADMVRKRRHAHGETNKRSKLTEAQVLEIRANPPRLGRGFREINEYAARYGVSVGTIYCSMTGRTWKHLPSASRYVGERSE